MNPTSENLFDRLPDDVLLSVFNRMQDAKSLCLSMLICKRFCSLALQVDTVFLQIPPKKAVAGAADHRRSENVFKNLFIDTLIKPPLRFISKVLKLKSRKDECVCDCQSYYTPNEILTSFEEIRSLHVRIPCYGSGRSDSKPPGKARDGSNSSHFLKWNAEFGSQMQSCVILGAKSFRERGENEENSCETSVIPDEELKLRIVWTISCLIAASARHELVQELVKHRRMVENVVITDESGQGRVCMNKEQIEDLRNSKTRAEGEGVEERKRKHSLRMKMWYMEKLEVPSLGKVVEGATVVVIRPVGGGDGCGVEELVAAAIGGEWDGKVIGEAVGRMMAANKCYTLEISSF